MNVPKTMKYGFAFSDSILSVLRMEADEPSLNVKSSVSVLISFLLSVLFICVMHHLSLFIGIKRESMLRLLRSVATDFEDTATTATSKIRGFGIFNESASNYCFKGILNSRLT